MRIGICATKHNQTTNSPEYFSEIMLSPTAEADYNSTFDRIYFHKRYQDIKHGLYIL